MPNSRQFSKKRDPAEFQSTRSVTSTALLISDDLLWGSQALAKLQSGGYEVRLISPPDAPSIITLSGKDVVIIVDLASQGFDGVGMIERLETTPRKAIGIYSHVDVKTRKRALAAGFDLVIPRSRFAREGAAIIMSRSRN